MELKRVVITGLGALTPIGLGVENYWKSLLGGVSGAGPITRFDPTNFKTRFACELKGFDVLQYLPSKEAQRMDPCAQYAMVAAMEALSDSGLALDSIDLDRVGLVVGTGVGGFTSMMDTANVFVENNRIPRFSPYFLLKVLEDMVTGYISLHFGFRGPNYVTSAACASAANAISDAMHLIQLGKADVMLSGGTEAAIVEAAVGGFDAMRALSTRNDDPIHASRPFDVGRDGFVMGEGAGILVLEDLEHAKQRGAHIYAELVGYGTNCDAYHFTAPAPGGAGGADCIRLALDDGGISPEEVDYINAHGTSTPLNDSCETAAIKAALGEQAKHVWVSSTKSMTGHLLGGAGGVEAAFTALALHDGFAPPTIGYQQPDPDCDLDYLPNEGRAGTLGVAISTSLGFGGHNACIVMKRYEEEA